MLSHIFLFCSRESDPIFRLCTPLRESELDSTSKKVLERPAALRGLRSSRSSTRTPTPTPSDSGSSTTSSSTDSSDTVDVENDQNAVENDQESIADEKDHPKNEINLDMMTNKIDGNDKSSELCQQKHKQGKPDIGPKIKEEDKADLPANEDKTEEHKSLIADNLHDYAHKRTPKSEPTLHQQNSIHEKDTVDNNSLHVYRQLLHLQLLQKQLESLKSLQRNQLQGNSHGPSHLPTSAPPHSLRQPLSFPGVQKAPQKPFMSQETFIVAPGQAQISPVPQRPSHFAPGQVGVPPGLLYPLHIIPGQHGLSKTGQISPGGQQTSPDGFQYSASGHNVSPDKLQFSPPGSHHLLQGQIPLPHGHCAIQNMSTPHPVRIYPNSSILSHDRHFTMDNHMEQAHFVRLQMQQMQLMHSYSDSYPHPGVNIQSHNPVSSQGNALQADIQRLEFERQAKLYEQLNAHNMSEFKFQESVLENMNYQHNYLNSVSQSHVPNSSESQKSPKTSLNNTIQKCVQNIRDPKQLVLQHQNITLKQNQSQEKQVLEIQKQLELEQKRLQEKQVNEIHKQLKLEVEKFHEQEIMQGILKDLLYKKKEKGESDKDKNTSVDIDTVNEQYKAHTSDVSKSYGYPVSACNAMGDPSNLQSNSNCGSIFKHPLPYHIPSLKQTDAKSVSSDCASVKLGLSKDCGAKISSISKSKAGHDDQSDDSEKRTDENKHEIPGFSVLVNSLTMCQSCQFLREYGVKKRSCSSCKDLKNTQNVLNTHWMPERQPDLAKSPTKNVSPGKTRTSNKVNKQLSPLKGSRKGGLLSTHTYSEKDLQTNEHYTGYLCHDTHNTEDQSEAMGNGSENNLRANKTLQADEQDPSKCFKNCVNRNDSNPNQEISFSPKPKFDLGSNEDSAICNSMHNTIPTSIFQNSGSSNKHKGVTAEELANPLTMKNAYQFERGTHSSFDKKCNSDPELCKNVENRIMEGSDNRVPAGQDVTGNRGMKRSHSQSEVDEVKDGTEGDLDATGNVNDSEPASKKEKLMRCTSVPGWFGKGLNIKKRRKYY